MATRVPIENKFYSLACKAIHEHYFKYVKDARACCQAASDEVNVDPDNNDQYMWLAHALAIAERTRYSLPLASSDHWHDTIEGFEFWLAVVSMWQAYHLDDIHQMITEVRHATGKNNLYMLTETDARKALAALQVRAGQLRTANAQADALVNAQRETYEDQPLAPLPSRQMIAQTRAADRDRDDPIPTREKDIETYVRRLKAWMAATARNPIKKSDGTMVDGIQLDRTINRLMGDILNRKINNPKRAMSAFRIHLRRYVEQRDRDEIQRQADLQRGREEAAAKAAQAQAESLPDADAGLNAWFPRDDQNVVWQGAFFVWLKETFDVWKIAQDQRDHHLYIGSIKDYKTLGDAQAAMIAALEKTKDKERKEMADQPTLADYKQKVAGIIKAHYKDATQSEMAEIYYKATGYKTMEQSLQHKQTIEDIIACVEAELAEMEKAHQDGQNSHESESGDLGPDSDNEREIERSSATIYADNGMYRYPEMPFVALVEMYGGNGVVLKHTVRAISAQALLSHVENLITVFSAQGFSTTKPNVPFGATPPEPTASQQQANGNDKGGKVACVTIKVGTSYQGGKPQLQFECDGMEHSINFTKGVGDMVRLLANVRKSDGAAFTEADLQVGKKYGGLWYVTWEANERDGKTFRNVKAVTAS